MKKRLSLSSWPVKLAITMALLVALFAFLDLGQLRAHLADLRWPQVAMATLMVLLAILVSAWKWGLLLAARGYRLRITRLLRHYFVGLFFNNLLPSTVGGDAVRAWATARDLGDTPEAVGSVIAERLIAGIGLGLTAMLGLPFLPNGLDFLGPALLFLAINLAFVSLFVLPRIASGVVRSLLPRSATQLRSAVLDTVQVVRASFTRPRLLGTVLLASILFQVIVAAVNYFLFAAFDVPVPLAACVLLTPMAFTITMLPVSLSGMGVREAAYAFFFGLVGVNAEVAVLVSLAFFVLVALTSVPGAFLFLAGRQPKAVDAPTVQHP